MLASLASPPVAEITKGVKEACSIKSIKWTRAEPFEMNVKIEQELNFVVDNDRRLFLDVQEAKKVSERTVVR